MDSLRILVIDDDEDDYFILFGLLHQISDLKIECKWCNNNSEAVTLLTGNTFDLYFVDYLLGAQTGIDIISDAISLGASKPIVLLTGMGSSKADKKAVEVGAYDYLKKDELSPEKLERCIRYSLERYKHFKTIQDSEKKYKLIFENAFSFVFICDSDFKFLETNKGSDFILGYESAELLGKSLSMILPPEEGNLLMQVNTLKTLNNYPLRFCSKTKDWRKGTLSISHFTSSDLAPFWLGVLHDDTWRVQAEQSKLQIEKLNATQRLVQTLAHEIRNPLTNMGLAVAGLQDFECDASQREFLDILQRSGVRINSILSELLQSSKDIDLEKSIVDLRRVIRESLSRNADRAALKKIQISSKLPGHSSDVKIDAGRFTIALSNIIINAIEAVEEKTGEIQLELIDESSAYTIIIRDNGCGISEKQMTSLFEPYYTTKRGGVGLGLVATLNILKAHKAQIDVKSAPSKGSTFTIHLPKQL